jgi:predicted metal-dependent hydrolase
VIWRTILSTGCSEHALRLANGESVPLVVQRHRLAQRMRLRFDGARGEARLTIPQRMALSGALRWAAEQAHWVEQQRLRMAGAVCIADGALIPVEGRPVRLVASGGRARYVALEEDVLIVGGPADLAGTRAVRWLQVRARALLTAETEALAAGHDLPLRSVSIGDPRTRWGSCAANGAIRYSWRLVLAPPSVRQATVAHEVAHLRHMNHGPDFHALVRAISPADPDAARAWLRREGAGLHRYRL